jgi:hypothetical protein
MERQTVDLVKKIVIVLGICVVIFFIAESVYRLDHESDPYIIFHEIPVEKIVNSTVIHLTDEDILNKPGWEVQ